VDDWKPNDDNQTDHATLYRHRTRTDWVKQRARFILAPTVSLLSHTGIHPNFLSIAGFAFASAAAVAVATGNYILGGWLFLVSGPFDALDGALAREAGLQSRFGAFLDSCLDRYSEAAVLFGISYWCAFRDHHVLVLLCFLSIFGSLMVSYTRARAEGLNMSCKVGICTRMERFVVLTLMLFTRQLTVGLALLAILTNLTALQRILHVYRQSARR
jgi:CDP-diacylglycerol--glycerol-3-phosphate 3-phosphatidyltransferase